MSYGPGVVFTVTMASGGTLTSAVDLGRAWRTMYLEVPSMTSNSDINIQAAPSLTGNYKRMRHPVVNTATVQSHTYTVASSATNGFVPIPGGARFIKIETTATIDSGQTFKIICSS